MIEASLILNIVVLVPVCIGLLLNHERMVPVFGPTTTAREILLCMYFSILLLSALALASDLIPLQAIFGLFLLQIFYKLMSVFLIKNKRAPVLWFNLFIAVFHSITLWIKL